MGNMLKHNGAREDDVLELACVALAAIESVPDVGQRGFLVRCDTEDDRNRALAALGVECMNAG